MSWKISSWLDWLQRGQAVWQVLLSIGAGKVLETMLPSLHVPPQLITPVWILASAAVMFVLVNISRSRAQILQNAMPSAQGLTTLNIPAELPKHWNDLYKSNAGVFLEECDALFQRLAANYSDPSEKTAFLIRTLAVGTLMYCHDMSWTSIFRSQLRALGELNKTGATAANALKPFYDEAAGENPITYAAYGFDNWLNYMKEQNLIRQDGNVIQITVRGKDFLKYMVLTGKSEAQRKN